MRDEIDRYWHGMTDVLRDMPLPAVARAADLLLHCQREGRTVFVLGNGGSAATASHLVCDLAKGTRNYGLPTFRAVALTDNVPLLTAWSNDNSYEHVFAEQLSSLIRRHDVVIAISASGTSPNVVRAARVALDAGATLISLTGRSGGHLLRLSDHIIRVPSDSIEMVEDAHLIVAHSICVALREALIRDSSSAVEGTRPSDLQREEVVNGVKSARRVMPRLVK